MVHILARNQEQMLPLYLKCIEEQDYPKDRIVLYIKTNNNTDQTQQLLTGWVAEHGSGYNSVIFEDYPGHITTDNPNHLWEPSRLNLMRHLRDKGFMYAREHECDFYFTADVDNFIIPSTISDLVELDLPVVAPMLRYAEGPEGESDHLPVLLKRGADHTCSNFTTRVTDWGDTQHVSEGGEERFPDGYLDILNRRSIGVFPVELVHCTYLVRKDVFNCISYQNGLNNAYEYITFSYNLRIAGIQQWIDNRKIYGCLTMAEKVTTAEGYLEKILAGETPEKWIQPIDRSHTKFGPPDANFEEFARDVAIYVNPEEIKSVYDIGACNGNESIHLANLFPNAEITAFEPNPDNYRVLCRNIQDQSRITPLSYALSDYRGEATFYDLEHMSGSSSLLAPIPEESPFDTTHQEITVQVEKFEDLKLTAQNAVVWMDVQGNELSTLRGFGDKLKRVAVVYTEVGLKPYYEGHTMINSVVDYMDSQGFIMAKFYPFWEKEANVMFVRRDLFRKKK